MAYRYLNGKSARVHHTTPRNEGYTLCGKNTTFMQGVSLGKRGWDFPQCLGCQKAEIKLAKASEVKPAD